MRRRDFLLSGASVAGIGLSGRNLFAGDRLFGSGDFGDLGGKVDAAFADKVKALPRFELPRQIVVDGKTIDTGFQWDGDTTSASPPPGTIWTHPMREGGMSATVHTLEQAKQAARLALQGRQCEEVHIIMPRVEKGEPPKVAWNKDPQGYVKPDLVYRNVEQITAMNSTPQEETAAEVFMAQIDMIDGINGNNWAATSIASFDRQLVLPGDRDFHVGRREFIPVGLFGNGQGLFGGGRRNNNNCGTCQSYPSHRGEMYGGSYAYTSGCCTGDNDLSFGSTLRGLLRFEFLRPVSHRMQHLTLGQRLVARIFPRVAYRKGWIDCETAHILLVKRLFVIIVAGATAGIGAAGGGGGMGVIFIP